MLFAKRSIISCFMLLAVFLVAFSGESQAGDDVSVTVTNNLNESIKLTVTQDGCMYGINTGNIYNVSAIGTTTVSGETKRTMFSACQSETSSFHIDMSTVSAGRFGTIYMSVQPVTKSATWEIVDNTGFYNVVIHASGLFSTVMVSKK